MVRTFKNALKLIFWDWSTLLLFELLYKSAALAVAIPALKALLDYAIQQAGLRYLTMDTLPILMRNPTAVLLTVGTICVYAVYIFIEMTAIVQYFDNGVQGKWTGAGQLFLSAVRRAFRILKPQNWVMLIFVLLMIPMSGLALTTGPFGSISIPGYIVDNILKTPLLNAAYKIASGLILILIVWWIFSIHQVTLEGDSFRKACKKSVELVRGRFFHTVWMFIVWFAFIWGIAIAVYLAALGIVYLRVRFGVPMASTRIVFQRDCAKLDDYSSLLITLYGFAASFSFIAALYYDARFYHAFSFEKTKRETHRHLWRRLVKGVLIVTLILLYTNATTVHYVIFDSDDDRVSIAAHRGGSAFAPENTIASLREAVLGGADYAEIDVQQTRDGELILMHDSNFARTTGVHKNVWEVDFQETREYDAGSFYSSAFQGEQIPSLREALEYAKGKLKLIIELKATGHETNLAEETIRLIEECEMEQECMIASMNPSIVETVRRTNPFIKTQYIVSAVYGNIISIQEADCYSVERTFVSQDLLTLLHRNKKELFVWTVNTEETMRKLIAMGVDGIVTDNPYLVTYCLRNMSSTGWCRPSRIGHFPRYWGKPMMEERR